MNIKGTFKWLTITGATILVTGGISLIYGPEHIQFLGLPMIILGPLIMLAVYKAGLLIIDRNSKDGQVKDRGMEARAGEPKKHEDLRLRWIMIPATLVLIVMFLCLAGTGSTVLGVISGMILASSPLILLAIYKAARIIIDPDLPNTAAIKGLIRFLIVFLVMTFYVVLVFTTTNWSVLAEGAGFNYSAEDYHKQVNHIMGGIAVFLLVGTLAVKFVVKGFKVAPTVNFHKGEIKKPDICQECGRVMTELDQPQNFENKIVCKWCFKKLKTAIGDS